MSIVWVDTYELPAEVLAGPRAALEVVKCCILQFAYILQFATRKRNITLKTSDIKKSQPNNVLYLSSILYIYIYTHTSLSIYAKGTMNAKRLSKVLK